MRYLFGFICVLALGVMPLMGCSETAGTGGSGGDGGQGGDGGGVAACVDNVCPCTEVGIRAAIAAGGGAYTFNCDGPTTVATQAEIVIDNDVILDGEGNLTVHADHRQRVFSVPKGVNAELHRLTATHGLGREGGGITNEGTLSIRDCVISHNVAWSLEESFGIGGIGRGGGGIRSVGQMTIINSTISENGADHGNGGGIYNGGEMTIINSTVSDNHAEIDGSGGVGGGINNRGEMTIINSTVSENGASGFSNVSGGGISNGGTLTLTHSTVWGNTADSGDAIAVYVSSYTEIANTLIDGDCGSYEILPLPGTPDITSNGYNIESPGDTCGFDPDGTDQVDVSADNLNLGPLADNGGPTMTHALLTEPVVSVAIDHIPAVDCGVTTDQRGEPRPETGGDACDVGSFERQPEDP